MLWTVSMQITDSAGNSRLVSGARLRWHDFALQASFAAVYLYSALYWAVHPLPTVFGWAPWLLGLALLLLALVFWLSTLDRACVQLAKCLFWLSVALSLTAVGQGVLGFQAAASVHAVANLFVPHPWITILGLAGYGLAVYFDPASFRNIRRDPLPASAP